MRVRRGTGGGVRKNKPKKWKARQETINGILTFTFWECPHCGDETETPLVHMLVKHIKAKAVPKDQR